MKEMLVPLTRNKQIQAPGHPVTKFPTLMPITCGYSVWNLHHVTRVSHEFWGSS